jgi:hypothetical protein
MDAEARAESRRVLLDGLRALAHIVDYVNLGDPAQPLPPAQTCRVASLSGA